MIYCIVYSNNCSLEIQFFFSSSLDVVMKKLNPLGPHICSSNSKGHIYYLSLVILHFNGSLLSIMIYSIYGFSNGNFSVFVWFLHYFSPYIVSSLVFVKAQIQLYHAPDCIATLIQRLFWKKKKKIVVVLGSTTLYK